MPTETGMHDTIARYVERFCAGDADAVADLYAPDATIEDPLGTAELRGREAIRAFYASAATKGATLAATGPVRARNNQCAVPLLARVPSPEGVVEMHIIDVMVFDDAGRIRLMRAFWGDANVHPVTSAQPGSGAV